MCPSVGMSATCRSTCAPLFGASGAPRTARREFLSFAPRFLCGSDDGSVLGLDLVRTVITRSSSTSKSASGSRSSSSELMSLYETFRFPRLRAFLEGRWRSTGTGSGDACSLALETWSTARMRRVDRREGTVVAAWLFVGNSNSFSLQCYSHVVRTRLE
jgi:hypothetical protein